MPDPDQIPYVNMVKNAVTPNDIRDIPIIGELYGSANAIIDFAEFGCFPHWTIWVDTLFPALGRMVLQILDFGTGDVLRGYFRPSNLRGVGGLTRVPVRGRPIKSTRRAGRLIRPGIPEIGNSIGKKLPGASFFANRKVTGLERRFWVVDFAVQRVLFYWLIADVTEGFITNWTTAIMESEACRKPNLGEVSAHIDDIGPSFNDTWGGLIGWTTDSDTTGGLWNATGGVLTIPSGYHAVASLEGEGYSLTHTVTGARVRMKATFGLPMDNGGASIWPPDAGDDPTIPIMLATKVSGITPINLGWIVAATGGLVNMRNITFSASIEED